MAQTTLPPLPTRTSPSVYDRFQAEAEPVPGSTGQRQEFVDHPAATLLPEKLLQPGEIIVLLKKPSPWYIVLGSLGSLATIGVVLLATSVLSSNLDLGLGRSDLTLAAVCLAGVRLFWQFLEWLSRIYVLTDRRVVGVFGVLRVHVFECQLKKIQHTTAYYSIRERLFGLGTIGFTTAGTAFTETYWQMVAKPMELHQQVIQAMNRYR